jgi:GNAT superfamily N-acetyltransferase
MKWLNRNPQVEFQSVDKVFDPREVGGNPRFVFAHSARKVDLTGRIVLNVGKGNIGAGPAEIIDFITGTELSEGGYTIFGIPSRNLNKEPNIRVSVERFANLFNQREAVDMVATEYGVASLRGRSLRERAQALIEIAHPEDRQELVRKAKQKKILYEDQIFLVESTKLYPQDISFTHTFKDNLKVHFRPIKPSDEEQMRRLFYRFSDEAVYARYFSSIRTMPHTRMQEYVNVDWTQEMSIVGLTDESNSGKIVAEGRYIRELSRPWAEVAFVVDQTYQRKGISTFLYQVLVEIARKRGIKGFKADVLFSNLGMMKVFHKGGLPVHAHLADGIYSVSIPFNHDTIAEDRTMS